MSRNCCAAIALTCAYGVANAVTVIGNHGLTSTVTGLDKFVTNASASSYFWGQALHFEFTVANGFSAPLASVFVGGLPTYYPNATYYISVAFNSFDWPTEGGIAFSTSSLGFTANSFSYQSAGLRPAAYQYADWLASLPETGATYNISNLYFNGGHGLNPSPDSDCASFSCMLPYATKGRLRIDIGVYAVPEPQTLLLGLAGLAIVGARAWRRTYRGL